MRRRGCEKGGERRRGRWGWVRRGSGGGRVDEKRKGGRMRKGRWGGGGRRGRG